MVCVRARGARARAWCARHRVCCVRCARVCVCVVLCVRDERGVCVRACLREFLA